MPWSKKQSALLRLIAFLLFEVLITIYRSYIVYFLLHLCADMQRFKTLALISKTKENIIVIFVFNERKIYNVMLIIIWKKVVIGTKFKDPIQHRFVDAYFNFCLHCFYDFLKIQNWFLIIPWNKSFLFYLQV